MSGGVTGMDIRLPIGLLFALVGLMLTIFGAATNGSEIYKASLGINVNLWWGMVLTLFGILMLIGCWVTSRKKQQS